MRVHHREADLEDHDKGLDHDLPVLLNRRRMLGLFAGASLVAVTAACGSGDDAAADTAGAGPGGTPPDGAGPGADAPGAAESDREISDGEIPEETAGPYPGDGSNGANVLSESGVVRSDIRSSFGGASATAEGVPLTIAMALQDSENDNRPLAGAAVYVWHCDRDGGYSMYSEAIKGENYLRGVQETDAAGTVHFTSIFPACYSGRWPHIHFEVYPSLAEATDASTKRATSQMALPEATCTAVYATGGYDRSVTNLAQVTLDSDNVFGDGYDLQIPEVTGDVESGLALTFTCSV